MANFSNFATNAQQLKNTEIGVVNIRQILVQGFQLFRDSAHLGQQGFDLLHNVQGHALGGGSLAQRGLAKAEQFTNLVAVINRIVKGLLGPGDLDVQANFVQFLQ